MPFSLPSVLHIPVLLYISLHHICITSIGLLCFSFLLRRSSPTVLPSYFTPHFSTRCIVFVNLLFVSDQPACLSLKRFSSLLVSVFSIFNSFLVLLKLPFQVLSTLDVYLEIDAILRTDTLNKNCYVQIYGMIHFRDAYILYFN